MNGSPRSAVVLSLLLLTGPGWTTEGFPAPDPKPASWIEAAELEPGRIYDSLVFETIPGVGYTVETSTDLQNWQPYGDRHYGLGHQVLVPMVERTPAGTSPPDPQPPASTPPKYVSLFMSRATGGGVVISFPSAGSHVATLCHLENLNPSAAWSETPLYLSPVASGYLFAIFQSGFETAPPASSPHLEPADAAMVAAFGSNFPLFDSEVQQSVQRAKSQPPALELDEPERRFFKVTSHLHLDSDSDGTFDWVELATGDPSNPGGPGGDPFNADTNNNGTADGAEKDSDSDGVPDASDVAQNDKIVDWEQTEPFLFATFPVAGTGSPLQANDQGRVLFEQSLWTGGQSVQLNAGDGAMLADCYPLGIGDGGFILGIGQIDLPGDSGDARSPCMVTWPVAGGNPVPVRPGGKYLVPVSLASPDPRLAGFPPPSDMTVNAAGKFIAHSAVPEAGPGPDGPESVNTLVIEEGGPRIWLAANGSGGITDDGAAPADSAWITETGIFCGREAVTGKFKVGGTVFDEPYTRVGHLPGGKLIAMAEGTSTDPSVLTGSWVKTDTLWGAIGVSSETGIVLSRAWGVWHNGPLYNMQGHERSPGLQGWDSRLACSFANITKHGWTLALKKGPPAEALLALPLQLSTAQAGQGLDTESAMASDKPEIPFLERQGNKDEFWVMVPAGGSVQFRVRSGANPATPVQIGTAGGISADPAVLSAGDVPVTLSAPLASAGQEIAIPLKIGEQASNSAPLRGKVMKPRVVELSVWPLKRPGHPTGNPPDNLPPLPSEAEFEEALNVIFKPQINATFDVTVQAESTLADDPGGLFLVANPPNNTQTTIAAGKSEGHIQVFVMGSYDSLIGNFPYGGWANPAEAWVWMAIERLADGGETNKAKWLNTVAHEVGHILLGAGHPDNSLKPGVARLPSTNHKIRLMHSGFVDPGFGQRRLLVKGEWDEAESWLIRKIDNQGPPQ